MRVDGRLIAAALSQRWMIEAKNAVNVAAGGCGECLRDRGQGIEVSVLTLRAATRSAKRGKCAKSDWEGAEYNRGQGWGCSQ